ncbi:DUF5994 family protein [Streptacidiphilus sp. EB129]|jgi:hypothetical protein|uniref:DUF5994 family protein n=1 Tax=Streptacidiphilus sp. EB129 TaxID=3156262 RepID=UPI0035125D08
MAQGRVRAVTTTSVPLQVLQQPQVSQQVQIPATAAPAVRLSLKPASRNPGRVDGAWWPRSRDLARELPALVAELDRVWGRITRVTVHRGMWPDVPPAVPTGTHTVRLGWFDIEQEPDDLCLLSYTVGRWDLLVVPPECDPDRAARLMATACDVHNHQSTRALMADAAGVGAEALVTGPPTGAAAGDGSTRRALRASVARSRAASWPVPLVLDAPAVRS